MGESLVFVQKVFAFLAINCWYTQNNVIVVLVLKSRSELHAINQIWFDI